MKKGRLLFEDHQYLVLWANLMLSTASGYFVMLSYSAEVFSRTGSNLSAASIFGMSWILPVLLVKLTAKIVSGISARSILLVTALTQMSLVLLLPFVTQLPSLFYVIFMLRGYLEAIEKTCRITTLKHNMPSDLLEKANALLNTAHFVGIGCGAILGGVLSTTIGAQGTSLVSSSLFFVTALLALRLTTIKSQSLSPAASKSFRQIFTIVRQNNILSPLICLILTVMFFQGFHNVARTAYALEFLGMPSFSVSLLQFISTIAIISGASFVAKYVSARNANPGKNANLLLLTSFLMMILILVKNPIVAFPLYFAFIFSFEVAFTYIQNQIVTRAPKNSAADIFSIMNSLLVSSLALGIFIISVIIDKTGITRFIYLALAFFLFIWVLLRFSEMRRVSFKNGEAI
ncbi:MAG: MFS transporter [Bdellovibrionota bacterium]